MTLGELINQLSYGELYSIALKNDTAAIVSYTNLGLQALYNRFTLKVKEQLIALDDSITEYTLNPDVMVIDSIYDENGDEFALNDPTSLFAINQIDFETIQAPNPKTGSTISVIYRASPPLLSYVDESSLSQRVPIPPQLTECLLHYIGYRAHGGMDGNIQQENNVHYMRFVSSCNLVESLGLVRFDAPPSHLSSSEGISEILPRYEIVDQGAG